MHQFYQHRDVMYPYKEKEMPCISDRETLERLAFTSLKSMASMVLYTSKHGRLWIFNAIFLSVFINKIYNWTYLPDAMPINTRVKSLSIGRSFLLLLLLIFSLYFKLFSNLYADLDKFDFLNGFWCFRHERIQTFACSLEVTLECDTQGIDGFYI